MPTSKSESPILKNSPGYLSAWILACRPKTLTAAVVPIIATVCLVTMRNGFASIDWRIVILTLVVCLFIQIAANLMNDAADFLKGTDNETRLGPWRLSQSQMHSARFVMNVGYALLAGALLLAIPLVVVGGVPILVIGSFSLFFAYGYTSGPFPLAYLGLGDLFVLLFFGLIAVCGFDFLLTGAFHLDAFILGLQIGLLCTVLIAINNFRDLRGDLASAKKTLPVRFGAKFARIEILLLCFVPYLLGGYWFWHDHLWAAVLPCLSLPLAIMIVTFVWKNEPSINFNRYLAKSAALHLLFGLLVGCGFLF